MGQTAWYKLERVQVHRDSGIPMSYSPAVLSCVAWSKLLSISGLGCPHPWKLAGTERRCLGTHLLVPLALSAEAEVTAGLNIGGDRQQPVGLC